MKKNLFAAALISTALISAPSFAEDVYFPIIAKGFSHQFWQAVKAGAEEAATRNGSVFRLRSICHATPGSGTGPNTLRAFQTGASAAPERIRKIRPMLCQENSQPFHCQG